MVNECGTMLDFKRDLKRRALININNYYKGYSDNFYFDINQ